MTPNDLSVPDAVRFYAGQGLRPIPMWGVHPDGRCLCGGHDCNAGKHAKDEREPWKDGRAYGHEHEHFVPEDNIAIALGPWKADWLMCLDFDGPADPSTFFLGLPETLTQKSPRGQHLFFSVRPYAPLGNWVDCLGTKTVRGTGVDIRFARGKINVAPSRSAFGKYEWREWREPAPLPEHIIQTILGDRRRRGLPVESRWDRKGKRP